MKSKKKKKTAFSQQTINLNYSHLMEVKEEIS